MKTALVILSVVAAIAGEAPYNLPRPGAHAPVFNYPPAPAPLAPLAPAPQFPPQQQFSSNIGYNYQAPQPAPQYIQPAPQHQSHPPPPPPAHHHHHHHHPAPVPVPVYIPSQPAPLPLAPQPLPRPQPLPVYQPQPQPNYQQPSASYGTPQLIARAPVFAPQPAPQLIQAQPQVSQQQYSQQGGYNYQQPQAQYQQPQVQYQQPQVQYQQPQVQYQQPQVQNQQRQVHYQQPQVQYQQRQVQYQQPQVQYQPQAQPQLQQSAVPVLSSYQADSNHYNAAEEQTHRDALDSLVVDRVQDIIKNDEHSVARNAGYQSLVSRVALEQAKPSVEITSFVHTSPLLTNSVSSSVASSQALAPSTDYGLPSAPAAASSESVESGSSLNFLPQNRPAISYGPPN